MQKKLLIVLLSLFIIGCNNTNKTNLNSNNELPSVSSNDKTSVLSKQTISDIEAIRSQDNTLSFAYYTANKFTKEGNSRWYISQINGGFKGYVFSLMPIVDGNAGWGEVSKDSAYIDIEQENVTIGNIADNPTYEYKDWGLGTMQTNSIIQEDIELIRNSIVDIKWWFFKASNDNWFIVNKKGAIYKFGSNEGQYDWKKIDVTNLNVKFFIEDGSKKMKLVSTTTEYLPQLNLNHKSETQEIFKRNGCNFDDIEEDMFSDDKKEENYITAICQAGIMQGAEVQHSNFQPFQEVDRFTVVKVTGLVYNYEEVKKFCSQSIYDNNLFSCYIDFAKQKNFKTTPVDGSIKRGEFYIYLANLFWNQNISFDGEVFDNRYNAWKFLKDKGVLLESSLDKPAGKLYVPDFMDGKLLRWELATLVMRSSRIKKEELPSSEGGELPYSITPDDNQIPEEEILLQLLEEIFGEDFDINTLFEEDNNEQREEAFFIPKNSLPKTVNIKETSTEELPNTIVQTATENIGKKSPYTDGKNTIDTRLITTVYGQDVKYKSAKEMCNDYETQGKLEDGLPTDKDLKGSVVCYKDDTPGTGGKGHVAILADSKGEKEIGVQDTTNGVAERPTDKENIKGVIAPTDIDLPNFK